MHKGNCSHSQSSNKSELILSYQKEALGQHMWEEGAKCEKKGALAALA